jgi:hypothetical protein
MVTLFFFPTPNVVHDFIEGRHFIGIQVIGAIRTILIRRGDLCRSVVRGG